MTNEFTDLAVLIAGIVLTGLSTMVAEHFGVPGAHEVGMSIIAGLLALARTPNRAPPAA